jgi:uncharacterized protein YbaR (Trm112 family)
MPIKIECPRCKTPLQVPNRLAGAYVHCPHCKGRLWVAKDAPADATRGDVVGVSSRGGTVEAGAAPGPQPPPAPGSLLIGSVPDAAAPLPPQASSAPSSAPAEIGLPARKPRKSSAMARVPPAPPPIPPPRKKLARFITAEAADSTLRLAADGKLPALRLEEDDAKGKPAAKSRSVNPLVMLGVLSMSIVLSVLLVLIPDASPTSSGTSQQALMRKKIEEDYFGAEGIENKDLEPYQMLLRKAQQANTRGDRKMEREDYRKVLEMLRVERPPHERGLTGSRSRDKELKEAISVLLNGG